MAAAAQHVHISQSAVSLAISDLERQLGVQLFHRHKAKGVSLTVAGSALLPEARNLLGRAGEFARSASDLSGELTGALTVGVHPPLTATIFPRMLSDFSHLHPGVALGFEEGSTDALQDSLSAGRSELALMFDLGVRTEMTKLPLFTARPRVVLSAGHRLAGQRAVRLRDLADEPMIMVDLPPSGDFYRSTFDGLGITPRIRHQTGSVEGVRSLVARGAGWSILLQQATNRISYEGLPYVSLPIIEDIPSIVVVLIALPGRLTRRAQAFRDYCDGAFPAGMSEFEAWTGTSPSS